MHAILRLSEEGEGLVVTLNHLGSVLGFAAADVAGSGLPPSGLSLSAPVGLVDPVISTSFADDLERTVAVGPRLVGSRPASSPDGGLLVSEPVHKGSGSLRLTPRWLSRAGAVRSCASSAEAATNW